MDDHIRWTATELKAAGINKPKLRKLIRLLRSASEMMHEMRLTVYGESGTGYLIHDSRPEHVNGEADFGAIVAEVGTRFDGGGW